MEKILGLDLGTNSIGWAIREVNSHLENQIIDKGVMTFDKGVAEDKSGEHPMVQKRTESRGKRRNYQAEKYRKWALLECLIQNEMCPLTIDELNEWRHYQKGAGRKYPQSEKFIQWLRFDFNGDGKPDFERLGFNKHESYYLFRKLIVDADYVEVFKKEPYIIGRVLYQLVQRRGYNDGENIDDKEKEELSETIMKGKGEAGAAGVNDIKPYIDKYKTLGAALYQLQKEEGVRIRKRYNLRSDFAAEIKEICCVQGLEYLYKAFWGAIIWQRPLRSQKGLVGVCTFEPGKRRCPISHPLYEVYRAWVFINNLKIKPIIQNDLAANKMPLQEALHTVVYPLFFRAAPDFPLSTITKELKKAGFEITARFPEDTKVISFSFLYRIKELFGADWATVVGWNELLKGESKTVKYNIEDLWHLHFTKMDNKETGETSFDFLKKFASEKLSLDTKSAESFAKIRLQQGYATLSSSAIKKVLPYLQQGFLYSEAIYLANLHKVMGRERLGEGDIENFSAKIREVIRDDRRENRKIGIINNLIATYFEDNKTLEQNKIKIIQQQIIESYGQKTWEKILPQTAANIEDEIIQEVNSFLAQPKQRPENHYRKTGRLHDKIFNAFMDDYGLPAENIDYLWHPSEQELYKKENFYQEIITINKSVYIEEKKVEIFLKQNPNTEKGNFFGKLLNSPEPDSKGFKNPMALKTLHKLKRLINYLIEVGKIDSETRVVVELARELNDANKRKAIERWQREREKENEAIKKQIDEINKDCGTDFNRGDKNLINKIRLWEEQKRLCIYTGNTINLCDLLNGAKYDFEHTIPASMSFDNELKNLTIADKRYNEHIKSKRLPTECPNYESEYTQDGITCKPILSTLQSIFGRFKEVEKKVRGKLIVKRTFEKNEDLIKQVDYWVNDSKRAATKERKDYCIQQRHFHEINLDYWRYKLRTFTDTEYKAGWRNSQLRDTQTITKYALPYLKTVFKKVEVQKGEITADFRKIYKIQPRLEKKDRSKHSHHAIDAAVLTLIPPAAIRDKILLRYNEANDKHQGYHEKPRFWSNFHQNFIIGIEDDILINFQAQNRTLTPTYKNVRKRGNLQFVTEKLPNGKWQYKLNANGDKIPKVAQGDSIRGQLHNDSFFAARKLPVYKEVDKEGKSVFIPQTDGKGSFIFEKNPDRNDNLFFYSKPIKGLSYITKPEEIDLVIDPNLRAYLKRTVAERMNTGKTFVQAWQEPIWAFGKKYDKHGNSLNPIRNLRCRVKAGGGFVNNPAEIRSKQNFLSKQEYKNRDYAINGELPICALYEATVKDKTIRELRSYSILEMAKNFKIAGADSIVEANLQQGKNLLLPLKVIFRPGQKVFFYKESKFELKELWEQDVKELNKRLYNLASFDGDRIIFIHHLCSLSQEDITKAMEVRGVKKGSSQLDFTNPYLKLRLSKGALNMAIEGQDFSVNLDGTLKWMF